MQVLFNKILKNSKYKSYYKKLKHAEMDRIFCKHDIEHSIDMAKLCMFYCKKNNVPYNSDVIYSAALLHDIGRAIQGGDHEKHSADIAMSILEEIQCSSSEIDQILSLISKHRDFSQEINTVESLFALADKKSRKCYECKAQDACK